jgi:choline dehydrogenase
MRRMAARVFSDTRRRPLSSAETAARFNPLADSWTMAAGVVRPKSRGRIRLTGPSPLDPVQIEAEFLCHPDDLKAAIACVGLCREIDNSTALHHFAKREVMPGDLKGAELEKLCPRWSHNILASDLYRQDGPGRHVSR